MGIPVSLILIAVGLVLALAVHSSTSGVDLNTVGWIIFGVGAFGLLLALVFWESWFGRGAWTHQGHFADPPAGYRRGTRRTVIEDDDAPPRR